MCGIAGYMMATGLAHRSDVRRMCDAIVHRGPDDEGFYLRDGVALGMRRLSIIDISGGHQPIHNEDRTIWVVFNGEIYNFPTLRRELEALGHQFYTNSDTECLVHLYEQYGNEFVSRLRGMFSFALYDETQHKLLIARDRMGKKPLHFALVEGTLYFGSEIKSILTVAPRLAVKNEDALAYYFSFGYIPDPLTAYKQIHKLLPGHTLEFSNGCVTVKKYWVLPQFETEHSESEVEVLERLEHLFSEAVKMRLLSDVPVGAFLSGGVDSSLLVGMMARHSAQPVRTFSIAFKNEEFNEAGFAKKVSHTFNTKHTEFVVEPDAFEILDKLSRMLDEPFADSSIIPTYLVSALARQHVTVVLSGDGGDELFAGYERYLLAMRRTQFAIRPRVIGDLYRQHIFPVLPQGFPARNLLYNLSLNPRDAYIHSITSLSAEHSGANVLSDDFLAHARRLQPEATFAAIYDEAPAESYLGRLQALDIRTYLLGDILTKVDRMSMAASLECRSPLLDHVFVEAALKLSGKWKIRRGERKYILKRLAERMGIPGEILYRRKKGFALPLVHWMRNELRDLVYSALLDSRSLERGYLNRHGVEVLLQEHMCGRRDHAGTIFQLLMFELWHRNYLEEFGRNCGACTPLNLEHGFTVPPRAN